jgi:hypothetical protein
MAAHVGAYRSDRVRGDYADAPLGPISHRCLTSGDAAEGSGLATGPLLRPATECLAGEVLGNFRG